MKLARLFLAVCAIGALAACGSTPTAPDAQPAGASRNQATCDGTWSVDPNTGLMRCHPTIGSGG